MGILDFKKEKQLGNNRLYTSYLINLNNKKAVLKLIHESIDIFYISMLLDEFILMGPLKNLAGLSNILQYQINSQNRHKFFIREFIDGASLIEKAENDDICLVEAIDICISIAEILFRIEKANLYHGALNPSNIIITPQKEIFILDPFINKTRFPDSAKYNDLSNFDLCFLPAEYFLKETELNILSDIYSIACIFYYLIAKKPPFYSDIKENIAKNHIWSSLRHPMPFDSLIHYILSPNKDTRPQSVSELVTLLKSFRSQSAVNLNNIDKPSEELNHELLFEFINAKASSGSNKRINFSGGNIATAVIITDGHLRYIEPVSVSDSFLNYLIKMNVLPNSVVDELFPFINDKINLINQILKLDFVDPEEIKDHYKTWISQNMLNKIIESPAVLQAIEIKEHLHLPVFEGVPLDSLLNSIYDNYADSIQNSHTFYAKLFKNKQFSLSSIENISSNLKLNSFETAIFSSIMQTPLYNDLLTLSPDKKDEIDKTLVKFLFLSLISLKEPADDHTVTKPIPPSPKKPPFHLGPLRKNIDMDTNPSVTVLKQVEMPTPKTHDTETFPDNENHPDFENGLSAQHKVEKPKKHNLEEIKVIAASLLHNAKEHYNNICFNEANDSISEALNIAPNNPTLLYWKARVLVRIPDEFEKAGLYFEKALQKGPENTNVLEDYSKYLLRRGEYKKAEEFASKILVLNPDSESARGLLKKISKEKPGKGLLNRFFSK